MKKVEMNEKDRETCEKINEVLKALSPEEKKIALGFVFGLVGANRFADDAKAKKGA